MGYDKENPKKLLTTEMDYLRRSCRKSKLERVGNETIRQSMNMTKNIVETVSYTHLCKRAHFRFE